MHLIEPIKALKIVSELSKMFCVRALCLCKGENVHIYACINIYVCVCVCYEMTSLYRWLHLITPKYTHLNTFSQSSTTFYIQRVGVLNLVNLFPVLAYRHTHTHTHTHVFPAVFHTMLLVFISEWLSSLLLLWLRLWLWLWLWLCLLISRCMSWHKCYEIINKIYGCCSLKFLLWILMDILQLEIVVEWNLFWDKNCFANTFTAKLRETKANLF